MPSNQYGTPQTEEEKLQSQMADFEFGQVVRDQLGPIGASAIDPTRATMVPTDDPIPLRKDVSGLLGTDAPDIRDVHAFNATFVAAKDKANEERYGAIAELLGEELEGDTVYYKRDAEPGLLAHEFRHRAFQGMHGARGEKANKIMDAWRTDSKAEWDRAVEYLKTTPEELRELLASKADLIARNEAKSDDGFKDKEAAYKLYRELFDYRQRLIQIQEDKGI